MDGIKKVTMIGPGAVGTMYASRIVSVLGKDSLEFLASGDRYRKYTEEGIYCNDEKCDFTYTDADTLSEDCEKADLLIFSVKGTGLSEAIEIARKRVGENTILISMLNGVSSEEELVKAFGPKNVLYCIVQGMDATKLGNRLKYSMFGEVRIGIPKTEPEKAPLLQAVTDFFDEVGIPYTVEEDIFRRIWSKWMLNVGLNQVVMAEEGTYATTQVEGPPRERMKAAMREVIVLSQKTGVNLTEKDLEEYVALMDTLSPEGMPSMRQDGYAHRFSEVEMFSGTVIRKGRELGVPTPVNEGLYEQVKAMEAAY